MMTPSHRSLKPRTIFEIDQISTGFLVDIQEKYIIKRS